MQNDKGKRNNTGKKYKKNQRNKIKKKKKITSHMYVRTCGKYWLDKMQRDEIQVVLRTSESLNIKKV